jgi:hypothetical protein
MSNFKDSEEQLEIFDKVLNSDSNILVDAKAGTGKCLGKGTKILMYDGSIKNVEKIIVGDILMGDDSKPRNVLSVNKDKGKLFKINPTKEKSFVCNDVHILTLKYKLKQQIYTTIDISLFDLLNNAKYKTTDEKNNYLNYYLYKEQVDFPNNLVSSYIDLGYNFFDQEIKRKYIFSSVENRLKILAGIVNRYGVIQYNDIKINQSKINYNKELFYELISSLGYNVNFYDKGVNSHLIKGDFTNLIPLLDESKQNLVSLPKRKYNIFKFSVEYIGIGDYYGFTLDGNGRFLLDNFIVTHNTTTIKGIVNRILDKNTENGEEKNVYVVGFNNHIAKELKEKLPESKLLHTSTTHAVGYGSLLRLYKKNKPIIDNNKIYKIIEKKSKGWNLDPTNTNISELKMNLEKVVGLCKLTISQTPQQIKYIAKKFGYDMNDTNIRRIRQILEESVKDTKTFDYNDMVYVPATNHKTFIFQNDYVIVDECLPSDQKLITKTGKKSILSIVKNFNKKYSREQYVLSYNIEENKYEYKKVINAWRSEEKRYVYTLITNITHTKSTDNHKYLTVASNGEDLVWKELKDLYVGEYIVTNNTNILSHSIGNQDINDWLQSFLMTRVLHKKTEDSISFENKYTKDVIEKYDKINRFNSVLKDKRAKNGYRYVTGQYYIPNYNSNKLDFLKNQITAKHLAIIYMDSHFKINPLNSFAIKAENFDYFLLYKKVIEFKFGFKEMEFKRIRTGKYMLYLHEDDKQKFINLIEKYLLPEYGTNIDVRYAWEIDKSYYVSKITKITKSPVEVVVYDITVEDNHNFVVSNDKKSKNGLVLHNCQDYNKAQQLILNRMLKKDVGRLISFGDRNQAIYGFMGADSDSFNWFSERENTIKLPLTTTYRCAKNIVKLAQTLVPDIRAREDAPDGLIKYGSVLEEAEAGDYVLARKNSPFVTLVFDLLSRGKYASILGKDIGEELKSKISKFTSLSQVIAMINETINKTIVGLMELGISEPTQHPKYIVIKDNMDMLRNITKFSRNVTEMIIIIDKIFTDKPEGIVLSTIHKSKGLEANRVFIIKPNEMKIKSPLAWMWQGELNLEYIAYTRAKNELIIDKDWTDDK